MTRKSMKQDYHNSLEGRTHDPDTYGYIPVGTVINPDQKQIITLKVING